MKLGRAALFAAMVVFGMSAAASGVGDAAPVPQAAPAAATPYGKLRGVARTVPGTGLGVEQFLGVPYAAAPVGSKRWREAGEPEAWDGVRDATWDSAPCLQATGGTEDCLRANVYRPAGTKSGSNLPVGVWVHGGANLSGSASAQDPSRLVAEAGIIVVTIQYRLGAAGFLYLPAMGDYSGNFAVSDIVEALRWVRKSIGAFGGDPSRVTLLSESTGSSDVCRVLVDKNAKGLFSGAVLQSDDCLHEFETPEKALKRSRFFLKKAGCAGEGGALACLKKVPASRLAEASAASGRWKPVAEAPAADLIAKGEWAKVPVLLGSDRNEARAAATAFFSWSEDAYRVWLERLIGRDNAFRARKLYPADRYEEEDAYAVPYVMGDVMTDSGLRGLGGCATPRLGRTLRAGGAPGAWLYSFGDEAAPSRLDPRFPGYRALASHGTELSYLFPDSGAFLALSARMTPEQKALARAMRAYWGNFVRRGNPNGEGLPEWKPYGEEGAVMSFAGKGPEAKTAAWYSDLNQCSFWDSIPPVMGRGSAR